MRRYKDNKAPGIHPPYLFSQIKAAHVTGQIDVEKINPPRPLAGDPFQNLVRITGSQLQPHIQIFDKDKLLNHIRNTCSRRIIIFTYINRQQC
ncbi:hypothetical protein D3C75_289530 [compost metagenome]